jgi:hypothetical protein
MDATRQTRPATDADRHRLAVLGRKKGIRILRDRRDGRYYASSASQSGKWYFVTAVSCDCPDFITHARCTHHSALLAALGWLPPMPPTPVEDGDDDDDGEDLAAVVLVIDGATYGSYATVNEAEAARSSLRRWASTSTRMDVRPAA